MSTRRPISGRSESSSSSSSRAGPRSRRTPSRSWRSRSTTSRRPRLDLPSGRTERTGGGPIRLPGEGTASAVPQCGGAGSRPPAFCSEAGQGVGRADLRHHSSGRTVRERAGGAAVAPDDVHSPCTGNRRPRRADDEWIDGSEDSDRGGHCRSGRSGRRRRFGGLAQTSAPARRRSAGGRGANRGSGRIVEASGHQPAVRAVGSPVRAFADGRSARHFRFRALLVYEHAACSRQVPGRSTCSAAFSPCERSCGCGSSDSVQRTFRSRSLHSDYGPVQLQSALRDRLGGRPPIQARVPLTQGSFREGPLVPWSLPSERARCNGCVRR